jgi:MFS transporter
MLLNRGICGFLGEILDYRWCITIGGTFTLLAGFVLILGRQKALRRLYEPEEERSIS